jgi:DNA-binding IclR family transcriptional regulator
MKTGLATKIYCLLSLLETKHNLSWADGLHRQILMAVLNAQCNGMRFSNQEIVDLNLTSRSSTYRKISDLKQLGFLSEIWDDTTCYLTLGPAAVGMLAEADNTLKVMSEKDH